MPEMTVDSPVGSLVIEERGGAVVAIRWGAARAQAATPLLAQAATPLLREAAAQLGAYFAGTRTGFDLPLAPAGSAHQKRVWAAMSAIPYGETRTYGDLAKKTGSAARAVGGACGANPIPIVVPCHRVVAANGAGGYSGAGGLRTKSALLDLESRKARLL